MSRDFAAFRSLVAIGVCLAVIGCSTLKPAAPAMVGPAPVRVLPKPAFKKDAVDEAIEYEEKLSKNYSTPAPDGTSYFEVLEGTSKVLIVAPHATCPTREGKQRFCDGGTGSLAVSLHKLVNATVVTAVFAQPSDPNYYDDNTFKQKLTQLLETKKYTLVLDLHASHSNQPYDVDLGTMNGTSIDGNAAILTGLIKCFRGQGLVDLSQDYFPAAQNATITKWAHAHGVPAVQLEINSTWLISASDGKVANKAGLQTHRFTQALEALVNYVRQWDSMGIPGAKSKSEQYRRYYYIMLP